MLLNARKLLCLQRLYSFFQRFNHLFLLQHYLFLFLYYLILFLHGFNHRHNKVHIAQ